MIVQCLPVDSTPFDICTLSNLQTPNRNEDLLNSLADRARLRGLYLGIHLSYIESAISWLDQKGQHYPYRTEAMKLINQMIGNYSSSLARRGQAINSALETGKGLYEALVPHFLDDEGANINDADILLAAGVGISHSIRETGLGKKYYPTPMRDYYRAVQLMNLTEHDVVLDPGCGVALTVVAGTHFSPATFIGMEGSKALADEAMVCAPWASVEGRGSVLYGNFLVDPLPQANKIYLYEPVGGRDAEYLAGRLKDRASEQELEICCYVPFYDRHRDVLHALLSTGKFEVKRQSSREDIVVVGTHGSGGSKDTRAVGCQ